MATILAPMGVREVLKCDYCLLVQFVGAGGLSAPCRRCKKPLDSIIEPEPPPEPEPAQPKCDHDHVGLSLIVRELRLASGLSQRQLAGRMSVPCTYVSKIENDKATPTLHTLDRLATALGLSVPALLQREERRRRASQLRLLDDPFVAAVSQYSAALDGMQRMMILAEVSRMATKRRLGPPARELKGHAAAFLARLSDDLRRGRWLMPSR
jgi:transcriptional regulator with XRE-family HTH domain